MTSGKYLISDRLPLYNRKTYNRLSAHWILFKRSLVLQVCQHYLRMTMVSYIFRIILIEWTIACVGYTRIKE